MTLTRGTLCILQKREKHCESFITSVHGMSPIATGNHLDRAEKIPKVAQATGAVDVFDPHSGISGPTLQRALACANRHE